MYMRISIVYDWIKRSVCHHSKNVPKWFDCNGNRKIGMMMGHDLVDKGKGGGGPGSAATSNGIGINDAAGENRSNGNINAARRVFRNEKRVT